MTSPAKLKLFYKEHRRMPSYSEVMKLYGYKSKAAAYYLIQKFILDGIVSKDRRGKLAPKKLSGSAALLGYVEAGFPSAAEEELLDVMDFDEYLTPNKEATYILKVKGDSMIDAGIREGDMVIVEKRQSYKTGQIVVASVDGEFTLKYLRKKRDQYYLEPANAKYEPIFPKGKLTVEAVVTAVVRKY